MAYNIALKNAVVKSRKRQLDVARDAGIPNSVFSQIVTGRIVPTKDEKRAIAKVLRRPVSELWPRADGSEQVA